VWRCGGRLQQGEIPGADVGVKFVFTGAGFFEGTKKPAVGLAERRGVNVSCADRRIHVGVLVGTANMDRKISGVEFDVFVAEDTFDCDVPGGNTEEKIAVFRQADGDLKVVLWSATEMKFGRTVQNGKAVLEILDLFRVLSGNIDGDFPVVGAHKTDITRSNIEAERDAGR